MERQQSAQRRALEEARRLRAEHALVEVQREDALAEVELAEVQSQICALNAASTSMTAALVVEEGIPRGWGVAVSRNTGQQYYYDTFSGFSTYERPWLPIVASPRHLPHHSSYGPGDHDHIIQLEPSMLQRVTTKDTKELQKHVQQSSLRVAALESQVQIASDNLVVAQAQVANLQREREIVTEQLQKTVAATDGTAKRVASSKSSRAATRALGLMFREDLSEAPSTTEEIGRLRGRLEILGRLEQRQQQPRLHAANEQLSEATEALEDELQRKQLLEQQLGVFLANPRIISRRSIGAIAACDLAYGNHSRTRTVWEQLPRPILWAYLPTLGINHSRNLTKLYD